MQAEHLRGFALVAFAALQRAFDNPCNVHREPVVEQVSRQRPPGTKLWRRYHALAASAIPPGSQPQTRGKFLDALAVTRPATSPSAKQNSPKKKYVRAAVATRSTSLRW